MSKAMYTKAERFRITAECAAPLHVGSSGGEHSEVMIHPVSNEPFIPSTSLCGVMRAYYLGRYKEEDTQKLFGRLDAESGSRIKFSDGFFESKPLKMEIRPRVAINRETGTADASDVKHSGVQSGHKFETESVGAGNIFSFEITVLADDFYKEKLSSCIRAMHIGDIQIGGQKSNGFGYIRVKKAYYVGYDMTKSEQRAKWLDDTPVPEDAEHEIDLKLEETSQYAYRVIVTGRTDGELLVKDIAPEGYGAGKADAVNIRNAKGDYIIPGSSLKGSVRSRMEWIAAFKGLPQSVIEDAFGTATGVENQHIGNLRVHDVVVGNTVKNDLAPLRSRIHIDKFTGGVMNQGLFSEKNVSGALTLEFSITKDKHEDTNSLQSENGQVEHADNQHADATLGLLLLALRDLAVKAYQLGSGYSVGKGYIDVEMIKVTSKDNAVLMIDFDKSEIEGETGLFDRCVGSLTGR